MVTLCPQHRTDLRSALAASGLEAWTSPAASQIVLESLDPEQLVLQTLEHGIEELSVMVAQDQCVLCTVAFMHDASCINPTCDGFDADGCINEAVADMIVQLMMTPEGLPN